MISTQVFAIGLPFMSGIGVPELVIILVIVLILFGPKRLPQLGKSIGKTVKSLKDGIDGKLDEHDEDADKDATAKKAEPEAAAAKKTDSSDSDEA